MPWSANLSRLPCELPGDEKENPPQRTRTPDLPQIRVVPFSSPPHPGAALLSRPPAIPSANSITTYNLIRLARITGNTDFEGKAKQIGITFFNQIINYPAGYTQMMVGLNFAIGPSYEIVIIGNKDKPDTQKMIKELNSTYLPNKVVIFKDPASKDLSIQEIATFVKEYSQIKNKATIYICRNQQCQLPTTSIEKMRLYLNS